MPALTDWSETAEKRASLYWWLSTLFTSELSQKQIEAYAQPEAEAHMQSLTEDPALGRGAIRLQSAIAVLLSMKEPWLELAADFTQLFLTDARSGVPPYASIYLSDNGLLFHKPHEQMLAILEAGGLAIEGEFKEPADHLAVQLDYLGNLIMKTVQAEKVGEAKRLIRDQMIFLDEHMLNWVPTFSQRCQQLSTTTDFYQACSELLLAFLLQDREYVEGVLR